MAITITVTTQNPVKPLSMPAARKVAGRSLANKLRDFLFGLDKERANSMGGRRTHFFGQAARSVQQPTIEGDTVTVSINQVGFAQRLFGGTIYPTGGRKFLTIPARSEAYGKRAGEFKDLEILFGRGGRPVALIQRQHTKIKRQGNQHGSKTVEAKTEGGGVFFWLVRSVTQQPDPSVLPTEEAIGEHVAADLSAWVKDQITA